MSKIDIMQESLCIGKIITVVKNKLTRHNKLISVKGRHSDAFVYIISGSCTYRFDDQIEFVANTGDVFYLPYKSHYVMDIHTDDYKVIFCDFEFIETKPRSGALYTDQEKKNVENLFVKLLNRYCSSSYNAHTECMSILYGIYSALQQNASKGYLSKSKEQNVAEAKRLIDEGFENADFSISMLSDQVGMSEVYLRRLFKAQYGVSPSKYLIYVRLKNAKKLMKYPFLSLEECALHSGFSSLQYFCRLFKKETGISPGKYKKEQ